MSQSRPVTPPSRWTRRRLLGWAILLLVVAGIVWLALRPSAKPGAGRPGAGRGQMAAMANMAVPVRGGRGQAGHRHLSQILGTVTAYSTVTVRSRVSGELVDVPFKEGQMVRPATCWRRSIRAPSRSRWPRPRAPRCRIWPNWKTPAGPAALPGPVQAGLHRQQQVDTQAALVRQYEGTVKSDQANVDNAKLQLDYSRITAPISGRLGLRQVDRQPGVQFRHQWPGGHHPDPAHLRGVHAARDPAARSAGRAGGRPHATVEAYDRADTRRIATGKLETLDNQIDVATGTLSSRRASTMPTTRCFRTSSSMPACVTTRRTPPRFPSRRCSRARPALSSSWSRTTIRWPCGRSSWAPSTTAWWRSTRACSPATGS